MGRKIPGRKHRGVRDPEKQAEIRYNSIKNKINAPPSNPEEQQIPHSLQRIIYLKNKVKSLTFRKKNKNQKPNGNQGIFKKAIKGKPEKPIPVFKQKSGETDRAFIRRMNNICMDVTKEVKFEEKYGVDIKRNADGQIEDVMKRPKDELELLMKKVRKEKKEKKRVKNTKKHEKEIVEKASKLTKSQKWALKKKQKKLKKETQNYDEFQKYKDKVEFGETVHAPPSLVAPRRVEKTKNAARPGQKQLLLKSVLQPAPPKKKTHTEPKVTKTIDKKGKRKDLPNALRRQLEKQQKEIIGAYKALKAKKYDV